MARLESIAIGGYYPTPPHIVHLISQWFDRNRDWVLVDPCAGEGEAILSLAESLSGSRVFANEMEATRYAILEKKSKWSSRTSHGDFFHLKFTPQAADVLYLNPPYDLDKVFARLEERFLQRATPILVPDGVLVFVVPYYALAASANTLATYYKNFQCYRFPDEDWSAYKQVVLFAQASRNPLFDQYAFDQIKQWATDPNTMPTLDSVVSPTPFSPAKAYCHMYTWEIVGADLEPARGMNPWQGADGFNPPVDLQAVFHKEYPLASRPRAAHIAAALSAGVFNGITVHPGKPGYPPLMVKGVFDREWKTVEEKHNKQGEKVAEVQVQQPKLFVSVLNLENGGMHPIRPEAVTTDTKDVSNFTMGDLLDVYGQSLMTGMLKSCPVLYDPMRDTPQTLPDLGRPLFPAQNDAVQTILRLHEQNPQRGVVVLGEIGSGKSSVALAAAEALHKDCLLIVAPPHLMDSWRDQTAAVLPNRTYHVLDTLPEVDAFFEMTQPRVGVISRERAKLSHGWETISGVCPHCGTKLYAVDYAKTRSRCDGYTIHAKNDIAKWLLQFAHTIAPWYPQHPIIQQLCHGRMWDRRLEVYAKKPRIGTPDIDAMLRALANIPSITEHPELVFWLCWYKPEFAPMFVPRLQEDRQLLGKILLSQEPSCKIPYPSSLYQYDQADWERTYRYMWEDGGDYPTWSYQKAGLRGEWDKVKLRSKDAFYRFLDCFNSQVAAFKRVLCNEFLYQAVPEPRRYPLAKYISQRYRESYDMLIVDEAHEFSNITSAQTKAAQRLMGSRKAFNLLLTGSFMNGYAESVFMNMQAISPAFRKAFQRDDTTSFIDRFGYWKQTVSEKDYKGQVVEFGKNSDRVLTTARKSGVAPGILPVFQLEHLLPIAVTLQKEDLRLGIPPCSEDVTTIAPTPEVLANYQYLLRQLMDEIKCNRHVEGRAGKLWGALAELPSYLDLAAIGQPYEVRWPESVDGGAVIASVESLDPNILLPKESWMLNHVRNEIASGRRVILMGWHLKLLPRYVSILTKHGFKVAHLESSKVPTDKRQDWIDKHVIAKNVDVLVVNPVTVQTGLNNLVYFATEIWMENPMCSPFVYRQACGRVDRIGQTKDTKILFPIYEQTAQEQLHQLLMHKVGVSKSVDGLDPEEALRAAGVLDSEYSGFSLGKQIYNMIAKEW